MSNQDIMLLGICGSVAKSRRTRALIDLALEAAAGEPGVTVDLIDLSERDLVFCDGRPPAEYTGDTARAIHQARTAQAYIVGTPIYRATYTGALKNLFDLIPDDALWGKVAGLLATGGSDHHYLALETGLKPILGFFEMHAVPGTVYAPPSAFQEGQPTEALRERVRRLAIDTVALARATSGRHIGPPGPGTGRKG
ncbi:MAG TPA: NAD(P)H-dependent oxidoreductase [Dehalococcoidia bacterium]|nr:NAD(P)H-dependent oxidoreductase [Dehalococcoidia bacterium]